MSSGSDQATVLVVDDEEEVADVYALRLRNEYETRTAYGGQDALEQIDDDVDVVLLDRRMPDVAGDDVLAGIRAEGYDCKVIMLTAVDPGTDILEMEFDDYLCKPVEKADLVAAIDQQLQVQQYDDRLTEYFEVTSKLTLLEAELSPQELEESDELQELAARADRLKTEIDESLDEFEDIQTAFDKIARHPG
ncbi:response regulator transcription factor [Salinibaculum rarum]|uniref:response regulator transcription factor n=1 Tax=Salinibaculum rarum TaxID=3058903 RepID=UPI00265E0B23|nr:response regulator [Salinibaculum sp. KK48]